MDYRSIAEAVDHVVILFENACWTVAMMTFKIGRA